MSKMNENKQIIPTKYTRNPPDHRHRRQITIFNPKHCCQTSFLEPCYFNGTDTVSTHVCVINDLQNIVKLSTLLSPFTPMEVVELLYVFEAYISQSLRPSNGVAAASGEDTMYFSSDFFIYGNLAANKSQN